MLCCCFVHRGEFRRQIFERKKGGFIYSIKGHDVRRKGIASAAELLHPDFPKLIEVLHFYGV
jgi:hypothetical protein